ncbi:hypothetical protein HYU22_05430 [Candidatus Woesearchaeota archaeon]|nr:hypothetical protein [Candidatus Woesearchaeota archaeon]
MRLKQWFLSKKLWLRGGIIGVIICLVLGLFNFFIYFPIANSIYDGMIPNWVLIPPMVIGHAFPILSPFIVPYGWLCKFTEPTCVRWSAESAPGAIPWTMEGTPGYCIEQTMAPTSSCANLSEMVSFFGLILLLFIAYFAIGAIVGLIIQKIKMK